MNRNNQIVRTLGGERVGSGNKMKVAMRNYERSNHNLSYIWRSTMAPGTLVPFMCELALPGDTFDISLNNLIRTHPTIGPLFGSYKVQMDVFSCPIRLYIGALHNNKLGIGLNMASVKMPLIEITAPAINPDDEDTPIEWQQINQSSLLAYLGIRSLGRGLTISGGVTREFNAIPLIAYWDIYKNYYANKQEEIGAVIHKEDFGTIPIPSQVGAYDFETLQTLTQGRDRLRLEWLENDTVNIGFEIISGDVNITQGEGYIQYKSIELTGEPQNESYQWGATKIKTLKEFARDSNLSYGIGATQMRVFGTIQTKMNEKLILGVWYTPNTATDNKVNITTFPLKNIDDMREDILKHVEASPFYITKDTQMPYNLPLLETYRDNTIHEIAAKYSQEGLAIKTFQSDIYNNWLQTEWISGENGINQITAIDTSDGQITVDAIIFARKVYDMLNRIAVSGGSYQDWQEAAYGHGNYRSAESPIYCGGQSDEVQFEEVTSMAESDDKPLGTLAGRGRSGTNKKGGKVTIKVDEPSFIIALVSLTPRLDYSQGNKWHMSEIKTMDDMHKPGLDQIGFQSLLTENMAGWDVWSTTNVGSEIKYSVGKTPAWIHYMTNVNQTYGNFAHPKREMYMTLNRRYEYNKNALDTTSAILDASSYCDPEKFNYVFADTRRDAQNFWVQIGVDIMARRKMSAKMMPNL